MTNREVGKRVRLAREFAGYDRASELASLMEMHENTLLKIERGERGLSKIERWALVRLLNVSEAWFTSESVGPELLAQAPRDHIKLGQATNELDNE